MALIPVGPLPAATYWRRRLVLLVGLVVLVLLVRSCAGGGGGAPAPRASATPQPTVTASATASPRPTVSPVVAPASVPVCADTALTLTASTDARSYPVGTTPRFTLTVHNTSASPCRRDLGGGQVEMLVYSGSDRIWSSDDCGGDTGVSVQTLPAGGSLQTTLPWSGKRSAKGCTGARTPARPGTYTLQGRVGTLRATASVFRLTA